MTFVYLPPGTILNGRYRIDKKIGQGGFGIIYEAYDLKLENRLAVKEFFISRLMQRRPDSIDMFIYEEESIRLEAKRLIDRFLSEARCLARIGEQDYVPNVYDYFEANHTAYIVMELLEGENLRQYMKEQGAALPVDLAVFIASQVGSALSIIHKQGIIHRDISPDNVFLCDDLEIRIKTLDFGAALLKDDTDKTLPAVLKVGYSPIEQYGRSDSRIGPWTDVYALSAMTYYMLTGQKPMESTIRNQKDELVPPHLLRPEIPLQISNAVMKGMSIDRKHRFQSAQAFIDALQEKKNTPSLEQSLRRRKRLQFSAVLVSFTLLLATAFFVYRYYAEKKNADVLAPAELNVWIECSPDSGEEIAMQNILADFQSHYPGVAIHLRVLDEASYQNELSRACQADALPDLFESTGTSEDILSSCIPLDPLFEEAYITDCLFLDQYSRAYPTARQFPLGIEFPVAYIVTSGSLSQTYEADHFTDLNDFEKTALSGHYPDSHLLDANFDAWLKWNSDGFMNTKELKVPVFLASSVHLNEIQNHLAPYVWKMVPYAAADVHCRYVYEWSCASKTEEAREASLRLLSWMTSEPYQESLMITEYNEGFFPINKNCFLEKADFLNVPVLETIYPSFSFGEWQ